MEYHDFELTASWKGGRLGEGSLSTGNLQAMVSIPAELNGPGRGTNPEEMLLGAAATCYLITLAAILERQGIEKLALSSTISVSTSPSLKVEKIIHRPQITIPMHTPQEIIDKIKQSFHRAEQACMISKALKGNVELLVEPELIME
jgi:peroxiredoxin-like protein